MLSHKIDKRTREWIPSQGEYGEVIVHAEDCPACLAGLAPEEELMCYKVESSGFKRGMASMFVCDEDGDVIAEAFGETLKEATARAEVIAAALNEDES